MVCADSGFGGVVGHAGGNAPSRVAGPGLGQVQLAVDHRVPDRPSVGQIHRDLRILHPTRGPGVLPLSPGQNVCRGRYKLGLDIDRRHRLSAAFIELARAIRSRQHSGNLLCFPPTQQTRQPFIWTKDADTITAKVRRKSASGTRH